MIGKEVWVDHDTLSVLKVCDTCSALESDKRLQATLHRRLLEERASGGDRAAADATLLELAEVSEHIKARLVELKHHVCWGVHLDRLPEDSITLLEWRIFYGLAETT